MPNWCQNRLTVEGSRDQLERLRDDVRSTAEDGRPIAFLIGNVVLEPPKGDPRRIPSTIHQGGWDWRSWRVENWGSKWDVCDSNLAEDGVRLRYEFDSAWAPPREGIRRMSMAYPGLSFTLSWFEWGMQFYGQDEVRNGESTEIVNAKIEDGAAEYDDDDEVHVHDPDLREFVQTHGFGFYA